MAQRNFALRRHIVPFTPVTIRVAQIGGGFEALELKLAFDMNAAAALQEKTRTPGRPNGLLLTETGPAGLWAHVSEPVVLRALLWAAALVHQPEYNTGDDEGLLTIGSFIQENNSDEIVDAVWKAYLAFLPEKKREVLVKLRAAAERGEPNPLDQTGAQNEGNGSAGSNSGLSPATTSDSASTSSAA